MGGGSARPWVLGDLRVCDRCQEVGVRVGGGARGREPSPIAARSLASLWSMSGFGFLDWIWFVMI